MKASFDVLKWQKEEKKRKKLLTNLKQYPERPIPEFRNESSIKRSMPKFNPVYSINSSPRGASSKGFQTLRDNERMTR